MNEKELDALLETWEAPAPSPALRENVRLAVPPGPRKRGYRWAAAAASVAATTALLGVAMLGKSEAQLADGTRIQASMQIEPASSAERWHKLGFGSATGGTLQQGYWLDKATHTYAGYDLTVEAVNGGYRMSAKPLSTPLSKLGMTVDAAQFRAVPLPALPAPRIVKDGEPFDIDLIRDPKTGDRVFERIVVTHPSTHSFLDGLGEALYQHHVMFANWLHSFLEPDSQLRLDSPKLYINDTLALDEAEMSLSGNAVYFELPGRGRYVVTLQKAGDQRFHRAGTFNGSSISFQLEGAQYRIVSRKPIAPGGQRPVYAFHEQAFRTDHPGFGAGRPDPGQ